MSKNRKAVLSRIENGYITKVVFHLRLAHLPVAGCGRGMGVALAGCLGVGIGRASLVLVGRLAIGRSPGALLTRGCGIDRLSL